MAEYRQVSFSDLPIEALSAWKVNDPTDFRAYDLLDGHVRYEAWTQVWSEVEPQRCTHVWLGKRLRWARKVNPNEPPPSTERMVAKLLLSSIYGRR